MGKATKWFRGLLCLQRTDSTSSFKSPQSKKWSLLKSFRENDPGRGGGVDAGRAVASAASEPSVAAAHAAAGVVKLTNSGTTITSDGSDGMSTTATGGGGDVKYEPKAHVSGRGVRYGSPEEWAAVKIQSHFRAYLSRRALRALKALVRLQALVRGSIVRKQNESKLRRWSKIFYRAQARARATRAQIAQSSPNSNKLSYPGPATPEKYEHIIRVGSTRRGDNIYVRGNSSKSNAKGQKGSHWRETSIDLRAWEQEVSSTRTRARDHDRSERIIEIDNGRSHSIPRRRNLFHSSHLSFSSDQYSHSFTTSKEPIANQVFHGPPSFEHHALGPMKFSPDIVEESPYYTADESPLLFTASSRSRSAKVGAFTPTKSDGSVSCLSVYSDHPNYMSYTESAKAKVRSLSAPKQRPQFERSSSTRRCLLQGYAESRINNQNVMQANFIRKAYPGSGRMDRLGMAIQEEAIGFSGGHWHPY